VEYTSKSPSGSVAFMVNSSKVFSSAVLSPTGSRTGGRFLLFTTIVMSSQPVSSPSLTSKYRSKYVPACSNVGVHENVLVSGLNTTPSGRLDAEYANMLPSGSVAFTVNLSKVFSSAVLSPTGSRTGGLFVSFTTIVMFSHSVNSPSLTSK